MKFTLSAKLDCQQQQDSIRGKSTNTVFYVNFSDQETNT